MNFLLDTCILSEFTRHQPSESVIHWMDQIKEERLFLSVISIGEIQHGIGKLPESLRKTKLSGWLNNDLLQRFNQRILPLDTQTLLVWGSLVARLEKAGNPVPVIDSLLAATALQYSLIMVTRNVSDFLPSGIQVINPWEN